MGLTMPDEVSLAQRLVQTPGLSGAEEKVAAVAEESMRQLGFGRVFRDELGSVVGLAGPPGETTAVLFDGHLDVAPVAGNWQFEPFGGRIQDGRLYGRGATDMKGGLAAAICGVAAAARSGRLKQQVAVSATVLEETIEGLALGRVADSLQPRQVVICEPSDLAINLGQKGRAELLLTVEGRPAHAAFPGRAKNPIHLAAQALGALENLKLPRDASMGDAILVATDIISDPYPSISLIPPKVTVRFDRRTLPGETAEVVFNQILDVLKEIDSGAFSLDLTRDKVRTYTGRQIEATRLLEPWQVTADIPLAAAARTGLKAAGITPTYGYWAVCTNGSETCGRRNIPTVGLGPGSAQDAHTADESIGIEEIRKARIAYEHLTLALA